MTATLGSGTRRLGAEDLALLALLLTTFAATWSTLERPIIVPAIILLIWAFVRAVSSPFRAPNPRPILLATIGLLIYDFALPRIIHDLDGGDPAVAYSRAVDAAFCLLAVLLLFRLRQGQPVVGRWRVAIVAIAAIAGCVLILVTPDPRIDVYELHQQAGDALLQAANPYADLSVFPSFPFDEASNLMTGYPYTPPNLLVFGGSAAITGDPRWFSLAAWLGFLTLFASFRRNSETGTALLLLVASQPVWLIVLGMSYTESLILLLIAGGVWAWRFRRLLGPLLMGISLASKQYLIVLTPMVLLARSLPLRRRMVTLLSAGVTAALGLLWGVPEYIDAVVGFHSRVPPQPFSIGLFGVTDLFGAPVLLPSMVGVFASIAVGIVSARSARTSSQLLLGAATALGVGFFLASQAFVNYWFVVSGILAIALLLAEPASLPEKEPDVSHAAIDAVN